MGKEESEEGGSEWWGGEKLEREVEKCGDGKGKLERREVKW